MHVLLSTYGSCGDVESSVGLAVLAVQVRGRRIVGAGVRRWRRPVRPLVTGSGPPSTADLTRSPAGAPAGASGAHPHRRFDVPAPAPRAPRAPPTIRRPRRTHTSTTTHACRDSLVRRFWPLPAIIWHDPGLAASPPVCSILKVERICTPIRSGATPTPAPPRCSPRNARNAPAYEPSRGCAGADPAPAPPHRRSSVPLTRPDVEPARLDLGRGARPDGLTHLQATEPTAAPSTTPDQTPTRARTFVVTARARLWRAMTRRQGRGTAPRRTLGLD